MVQLLGKRGDKHGSDEQDRLQGRVVVGEASPQLFGSYDEHFRDNDGSYEPLYRVAKLILPLSLYLTWSAFVNFQEDALPPYVTQKQVAEYTKKNLRTIELNMQRLRQAGYLHTRHAFRDGGCVVEKCFDGLYNAILEYIQWEQSPLYVPPLREYFVIDQLDWTICQSLLRFNNYRRLIRNKKPGPKQKKVQTQEKESLEEAYKEVPLSSRKETSPSVVDNLEDKTNKSIVLPINNLEKLSQEWNNENEFSQIYYGKKTPLYTIEEVPSETLPYEEEEPVVATEENQLRIQWGPGLSLFLRQLKKGELLGYELVLNERSLVPYTPIPIDWFSVFSLKAQYQNLYEMIWGPYRRVVNPYHGPWKHYRQRQKHIALLVPSPQIKLEQKQAQDIEKERAELRAVLVKMRKERAWLIKQVLEWEQKKNIYDVHLLELDQIEGAIVRHVKLLDHELRALIDEIWCLDFDWLDIADTIVLRARREEQEFFKKNNYRRYKGPRHKWQPGEKEIAIPIYRPLYPPAYYAEFKKNLEEALAFEDSQDNQEGQQGETPSSENQQMETDHREAGEEKPQQQKQRRYEGDKQEPEYQYAQKDQVKPSTMSTAEYLRNERVERYKNQQAAQAQPVAQQPQTRQDRQAAQRKQAAQEVQAQLAQHVQARQAKQAEQAQQAAQQAQTQQAQQVAQKIQAQQAKQAAQAQQAAQEVQAQLAQQAAQQAQARQAKQAAQAQQAAQQAQIRQAQQAAQHKQAAQEVQAQLAQQAAQQAQNRQAKQAIQPAQTQPAQQMSQQMQAQQAAQAQQAQARQTPQAAQQDQYAQLEKPKLLNYQILAKVRDRTAHQVVSLNPMGGPRPPEEETEVFPQALPEDRTQFLPLTTTRKKRKTTTAKNDKRKTTTAKNEKRKNEPKRDVKKETQAPPVYEKDSQITRESFPQKVEIQPPTQEMENQPPAIDPIPVDSKDHSPVPQIEKPEKGQEEAINNDVSRDPNPAQENPMPQKRPRKIDEGFASNGMADLKKTLEARRENPRGRTGS